MTDKTRQDSGGIITSSDILLHDADTALMYEELRAAIDDGHESMTHADALAEIAAIRAENVELRAKLESIGAGGAQALSAAPEAIAKLRHLYQNMVNGAVRDTASAKRIAEGLLAPAIEALERAAPPAEQPIGELVVTKTRDGQIVSVTRQDDEGRILSVIATSDPADLEATTGAALGGVYAELPTPNLPRGGFPDLFTERQMRDFADRTHALRMEQAAPKAAPVKACVCGEPQASGTVHRVDGPCYVAAPQQEAPKAAPGEPYQDRAPHLSVGDSSFEGWYESYCPAHKADKQRARDAYAAGMGDPLVVAAPQQEAQEPCPSCKNSDIYACTCPFQTSRNAAPQPAPAPLSDDVVKDAARYRWLRENWFTMTSNYQRCITFKVGEPRWSDITEEELDTAIDAALAAQGGE